MKILHRFYITFVALVALASGLRSAVAAQAFIIVDAQTGAVLQAQEPRQKRQIGSLTTQIHTLAQVKEIRKRLLLGLG